MIEINAPSPINTDGITIGFLVRISTYGWSDNIVNTPHPSSKDPQISDNELQKVKNTIFKI